MENKNPNRSRAARFFKPQTGNGGIAAELRGLTPSLSNKNPNRRAGRGIFIPPTGNDDRGRAVQVLNSVVGNKANRFWMYLIQKNKKIFTKEEVRKRYDEFQNIWKDKKNDFKKIFDSLRKTRLKYLFHKKWYALSKEEFNDLKNNKFEEYELILKFLEDQKIPYYIGLSSAKYLNKLTWQSLKVITIINTNFKLNRKIGNIEIHLIKFPKDLFVNIALNKTINGISYSNVEKTFLDEIFYNKRKKGNLEIKDYNLDEIDIEKIKAYLVFYSKYKFVKKEIMNKLNKEKTKLL